MPSTLPPILPSKKSSSSSASSGLSSDPLKGKPMNLPPDALGKQAAPSFYDAARNKILQQRAAMELKRTGQLPDAKGFDVGGTGTAFKQRGVGGFKKRFKGLLRSKKGTEYKNISKEEGELMSDIIAKRMKSKATGSDLSARDKKLMRKEATRAFKEGKMSKEDLKDFKKIVGGLKNE